MDLCDVQTLFEYNAWATGRTLEAASGLSPDQLVKDLGTSFPSVRDTLAHILSAEWLWLARWRGSSPRAGLSAGDYHDVGSLRDGFARVEAERRRYLGGLTEQALQGPLVYGDMQGVQRRLILAQSLQHVVNHGTYHRGQVTTMLRQLGATPTSTDLSRFFMERTA
jgi:uncharacterized damage-inducible protein DinB